MRKRAKPDGNQEGIVKALRKIPGVSVAVTSALGDGFPDIIVGYKKRNYAFEIKDPSQPPSKRRLTPDEVEWHKNWHGHIQVIETVEQVWDGIKII